jgi:hypothetical protein
MRVTAAREAIERARLNYDNQIQEAKLQNDSKKAEIAFQTLQASLELSLQGFQYKNQLIAELTKQKQEIKNNYYNRYLAELEQINAENALKETVRRNNAEIQLAQDELAEKKRQFDRLHPEVPITPQYKANTNYKLSDKNTNKKITQDEKKLDPGKKTSSTTDAKAYLNKLISSGASKDKVSNEIALALRKGAITKQEAAKLRQTFTPRGLQY